jgi:hypothetical protein
LFCIQRGGELASVDPRQGGDGFRLRRAAEALVADDAARRGLVESAPRRGRERGSAAHTEHEAARAQDLLGQRPSRPFARRFERAEPHPAAP